MQDTSPTSRSTDTDRDAVARPRPLNHATIPVDAEGRYEDGHGDPSYVENVEVLAYHHVAAANGWEHDSGRAPAANLRALLEATTEYKLERSTVEAFAFAFIAGFGPGSTPRALDALAEDGVPVPGGGGE